jgi:hypothetical protein
MYEQSRPRIYVAGPIRDPNPWVVEQNVRRAESLGRLVAEMGAVPVLVHTMYRTYMDMDEAFWREACLSLLSTCQALAVDVPCRAYYRSAGTCDEVRQARVDHKPTFYYEISHDITPAYARDADGVVVNTVWSSGPGGSMGLASWISQWTVNLGKSRG